MFSGTVFAKNQNLEFLGANEGARQGCGHAQLNEQVDEYQPRFQHLKFSREMRAGSAFDCTRGLPQKLLYLYDASRRNSALGKIPASTSAPAGRRQHSFEQRSHVRQSVRGA
jgi:hypothetical protein